MRTGEKVKTPFLLAVTVYAGLNLSKYNIRNTVWDVRCAEIYIKTSESSDNYDRSGLKITIFNLFTDFVLNVCHVLTL